MSAAVPQTCRKKLPFVMDRAEKMGTAQRMLSQGELP